MNAKAHIQAIDTAFRTMVAFIERHTTHRAGSIEWSEAIAEGTIHGPRALKGLAECRPVIPTETIEKALVAFCEAEEYLVDHWKGSWLERRRNHPKEADDLSRVMTFALRSIMPRRVALPSISDFVADYDWRKEDVTYIPTERECAMIADAISGYVGSIEAFVTKSFPGSAIPSDGPMRPATEAPDVGMPRFSKIDALIDANSA